MKKSDKKEENKTSENPDAVECPACGSRATLILDPKKITDKKTTRLCLVCGLLFEYISASKTN